ncbi:MAG: hypothetical protein COB76_06905 [Alphaproteobacteria bacterium]|nr:MAG: hypothetical protein COB76_06905 [Alphaproteobacteria bacterium]
MTIKSYLNSKAPSFAESEVAPIHLASVDDRHYYAFAKGLKPSKGGKNIKDDALEEILKFSLLIRQIKEEAGRRITAIAPTWKQQNALTDLYLISGRDDLNEVEQEDLTKAQDLLAQIKEIRKRSDEIEASFLDGVAVDYLNDKAWEV